MLESIEIFERMAVLSVTLLCLSFKPPFYRDLVMLGQRPTCTGPAGSLRGPTDGGAAREPERDHGGTFHFMLYRFPSSLTPLLQDRAPAATRFYVFLYTCRPTLIMSPCPPGKYSRQLVGTPFQAQSHPCLNPDQALQGSSSKFLQVIQSFSLYSPNLCSPVTAAIPSYRLCDTESSHRALFSNQVNQSLYRANNFSIKFSL